MNKILTLLFFLTWSLTLFAQNTITGTVTDTTGFGLPGVAIQVVGTGTGTITDINGNYQITAKEGVLKIGRAHV